MRKILFYIIMFLLFSIPSFAATYYVCETATGDESGNLYENCMDVADHNAASFSGDDVIYLCDTITSRIMVPSSGTSGHYITYRGDYAGHPGELTYPSTSSSTFNTNGKNYITIIDLTIHGGYIGIAINGGHDVIVKKCTIYEMILKGIYALGYPSNIVIGGASGDGNDIYDIGCDTGGTDISFSGVTDGIVSYNKLYATDPDNWGIDGVATHTSSNILIEYNKIYSHNHIGDGNTHGEDGIDLKNKSNNITIRYNHIYDHVYQTGITVQLGAYDVNIYGNSIHDSRWAGVYIKRGYQTSSATQHDVEDVRIWSNLIYKNASGVMVSSSAESGNPYTIRDILVYNNVLAENGNKSEIQGAGVMIHYGTGHIVKNNIFYKNTDDTNDSIPYQQVEISNGESVTFDNNFYYHLGLSGQDMFTVAGADRTLTEFKALGHETNGVFGDPKFTDPENNDYTLDSDSPAINAGEDLSECFGVTIQGTVYTICKDDALDPNNTDFSTSPPTVATLKRDDYKRGTAYWDCGAYVYEVGSILTEITGAGPSGEQTCTSDPRNVTMSWNTDVSANCRISDTDEGDYDDMPVDSVTNTDSTVHSDVESLACDASYDRYVYCEDGYGNEVGPTHISFSIESGEPPDPQGGTVGNATGGSCSGGSM